MDTYDPVAADDQRLQPVEIDYSIPGDLVLIFGPGPRPGVVVRTPSLRPDWIPALDADAPEAPPGAAATIEYRGTAYEISDLRRHGSAFEYHLNPWPAGELMRQSLSTADPRNSNAGQLRRTFERRSGLPAGYDGPTRSSDCCPAKPRKRLPNDGQSISGARFAWVACLRFLPECICCSWASSST